MKRIASWWGGPLGIGIGLFVASLKDPLSSTGIGGIVIFLIGVGLLIYHAKS
jgi:hypothetical protein